MSATVVAPKAQPPKPIDLLPNDIASVVTHLQPIVYLSSFYLIFPSIVIDPVATLLISLVPLAFLQAVYCIACLPAAGSAAQPPKKTPKSTSGAVKKPADSPQKSNIFEKKRVQHALLCLLLTAASILVLAALQVLLGAPLTTHLQETFLSSAHLAVLAFYPLFYVHGVDSARWLEVCSAQSPLDEVFGATVGALVGAWLGAVPIPLDWDREWQKWPVTIVTGIYLGYVLGKGVGGYLVKGMTIKFD